LNKGFNRRFSKILFLLISRSRAGAGSDARVANYSTLSANDLPENADPGTASFYLSISG